MKPKTVCCHLIQLLLVEQSPFLKLTCTWLRVWVKLDTFQDSCLGPHKQLLVVSLSQLIVRTNLVPGECHLSNRVAVGSEFRYWFFASRALYPFQWTHRKRSFQSQSAAQLYRTEQLQNGKSCSFLGYLVVVFQNVHGPLHSCEWKSERIQLKGENGTNDRRNQRFSVMLSKINMIVTISRSN